MIPSRTAFLFPGQGSLSRSSFAKPDVQRQLRQVLEEIGSAESECKQWMESLREGRAQSNNLALAPDNLAIFILAASVAQGRTLESQGLHPGVMIGHGFGEVIALICAGALSVAQGAEIVFQRTSVLNEYSAEGGGMLLARTTKPLADALVELAGHQQVAVAAENSPTEVVISGTAAGLEMIQRFARNLGIVITKLRAPWALHCRAVMAPAAAELKKRLAHISSQRLRIPVFSPTLGRYYSDTENLSEILAEHLVLPVRFTDAIRHLLSSRADVFVECGPLCGLGRCVQEIAGGNHPSREFRRVEYPQLSPAIAGPGTGIRLPHPELPRAAALAS
jgi:[acyl-carrier-protein] S-malonyltransferase